MSANATGTPTVNYSIPKFNTASDAPNGRGTNEMMDAIDTVIKAQITPFSFLISGAVNGDGSQAFTSSAYSVVRNSAGNYTLTLPTSPTGHWCLVASVYTGAQPMGLGVSSSSATSWQLTIHDVLGTTPTDSLFEFVAYPASA